MGQQKLIYSLVARGTVVLADYTEFKGNFGTIAAQCLQKLSASNNRFSYTCDDHTFNYLVDNGFSMNVDSLIVLPPFHLNRGVSFAALVLEKIIINS